MPNTYFISDTHFGHKGIITFTGEDGKLIRPGFSSLDEMDELMVENWNKVVRPQDRVYHLGDICMNRRCLPILSRLNGKKVLVKGNHDIWKLTDLTPYFEDIRAYKVMPKHGIICSHIPIHPGQLEERFKWNIHGHLHEKELPDTRYINVSVEQINYTPVPLEGILDEITRRSKGNADCSE